MRTFFNGICFISLVMLSSLATAADTPSLSGTTIPSATQIVDANLNVWSLTGGKAYANGQPTPSSGVILLLCYGGTVYQENSQHDWWLWDSNTSTWATSVDPRVISPSGTTVPVATQLVDSALAVWTLSGGQAYVHGTLTPSSGVIKLLYTKGIVFQENNKHLWFQWRDGAWETSSAPPPPSASGTAVPAAKELFDNGGDVWTLSGGQAYENHEVTPSSNVILLLFYGGIVYQENNAHLWWEWNGEAWKSTTSDPRVGSPLAFVASTTGGKNSVTVIDTGTNKVKATIPIAFEASYLTVTPDAKHVYAAGSSNDTDGSVAVIDTAQEKVVASIKTPYVPSGIVAAPNGKKVFVVSSVYNFPVQTNSTISTIDTVTNAVVANLALSDDDLSLAISSDGKKLYLAAGTYCGCASQMNDAFIDVVDVASNSLASDFNPPLLGIANEYVIPNAVISPNGAKLYSNTSYYYPGGFVDQVAILNPETGAETKTIPAVLTVQVFSPDSQHLYGVGLGGVGVINTATEISTTAVANIPGASGMAITPDGTHLYITDMSTNSVLVADTASYTISTVLPLSIAGSGAIAIVSKY